jgi:superfamily I DNA and/or RNA helicase
VQHLGRLWVGFATVLFVVSLFLLTDELLLFVLLFVYSLLVLFFLSVLFVYCWFFSFCLFRHLFFLLVSGSFSSRLLEQARFPFVVVDECSQAVEPASLIALTKGCEWVTLLGDHKQLPPTVISKQPEVKRALGQSLFDRLAAPRMVKSNAPAGKEGSKPSGYQLALMLAQNAMKGSKPKASATAAKKAPTNGPEKKLEAKLPGVAWPQVMLQVQYRMHPRLAEFPSKEFYDNEVVDGVSAADRPSLAGFPWPESNNGEVWPIAFVPSPGFEEKRGMSFCNTGEANAIVAILRSLPKADFSLGIVTPYQAQAGLLRQLLRGSPFQDVTISTVDAFQGQERDFIIMSTVRGGGRASSVGFVRDPRRFNVAVTRPRRGLIVLGKRPLLEQQGGGTWSRWFKYVDQNRLTVSWPPR